MAPCRAADATACENVLHAVGVEDLGQVMRNTAGYLLLAPAAKRLLSRQTDCSNCTDPEYSGDVRKFDLRPSHFWWTTKR